jgi:mercuric ion transport protein
MLPAIAGSLLPNVACPACWPAYAAAVGSMGLGFVLDSAHLLPLTAALLSIALAALAYGAKRRRGVGPLLIGVAGAAAVLVGKFSWRSDVVLVLGVAALLAASVWSSWPRRAQSACARCESSGIAPEVG